MTELSDSQQEQILPFNPFDPTGITLLYTHYARLREQEPIHWNEQMQCWFTFSYPETALVMSDARFGKHAVLKMMQQNFGPESAASETLSRLLFFLDPPEHTRLRGVLTHAFSHEAIERLRPRITDLVSSLLAPLESRRTMDGVRDLADRLPLMVIADLLGVPECDDVVFEEQSHILAAATDPFAAPRAIAAGSRVLEDFHRYFSTLVAQRRLAAGSALIDDLIAARDSQGDHLTDEEIADTGIQLLFAGYETTSYLIGNALFCLLSHPEQWSMLCRNRSLLKSAVEEVARYESPVQFFGREVIQDITIQGKQLREGQMVFAAVGSANRDPQVYCEPDHFTLTRFTQKVSPHLSFGRGFRYCLGAQLARLEAEIVLDSMLTRFPSLHLVTAVPHWRPMAMLRALGALPLAW